MVAFDVWGYREYGEWTRMQVTLFDPGNPTETMNVTMEFAVSVVEPDGTRVRRFVGRDYNGDRVQLDIERG